MKTEKVLNGINGNVSIPGDKSISHRSIIISSISNGTCEISNLLCSEDVLNTLNALKNMGVKTILNKDNLIVEGKGLNSLKKPISKIDLGNSGTSARLLTGLLSSQKFDSVIYGDDSLSKRPMDRIINPLEQMGAKFISNEKKLPITIIGKKLQNIEYELKLPSAQVKSGIMLAALNTNGKTKIVEKEITRNHTEIMLSAFGADISINKFDYENHIYLNGGKELVSKKIHVPSDLSSAAFFIVGALINKNSEINMENINLNPTRTGILKALNLMGGKINIKNKKTLNDEEVGDLLIKDSDLNGCELNSDIARLMIDEYPILSIAASFANSPSVFKGLGELKHKESNRLELIRYNLDQCGIFCQINGEDLIIDPNKKIEPKGNKIITNNDHRIAMAFAIMGTKLGIKLEISGSKFIKTSFPNFKSILNSVGGIITE